ncbi:MAG: hypothetical protein FD152_2211 [Xanthobacteraceae bacterium]|nr:MAG: hypothetical protein FD152_2211 [Xanthobacteraceae bacterium]
MGAQLDIAVQILGSYTGSNDIAAVTAAFSKRKALGFTPGTGAGQADKVFSDTRSIPASSNDDLDLTSLTDPLGAALAFAGVKAIYIEAAAANINEVVVGGHDTAAFLGPFADASDKVKLKAGEVLLVTNRTAAGWAVTATTADILRIANGGSGSAVGYSIILVGDSA